jgi:uncharacterized integral membrane protein
MASAPTTGRSAAGPGNKKRGGVSISPKLIGSVLIIGAALWFILANTGTVHIHLWIPTISAPMWLVLMITFVGGFVTGMLMQRRGKLKGQQQLWDPSSSSSSRSPARHLVMARSGRWPACACPARCG